jgi:hypothetical protein
MYEIRDPIHGTISFSERERSIVDHRFMQRLRHIRHLGLTYLVYPGATHDRFSHSLGAMHVISRIWDRVNDTSREVLRQSFEEFDLQYFRRILRSAALLHDVGHPPLSHVSERFMPKFSELQIPADWISPDADPNRPAKHEDYSILLIAAISQEDDSPLSHDEAQDIASLVHHEIVPSSAWEKKYGDTKSGRAGIHRLMRSLISGELDCDRMDYLLRDAHYTGVSYGAYDMDHLIGNLGVTELDDRLVLTIDSTAVRAFEDFLLARYHMFLQVYLHKTILAFDLFLEKAITTGEVRITIPGAAEQYTQLRDSTLTEQLFAVAGQSELTWSKRLLSRTPPKMLFRAANRNEDDRGILKRLTAALERSGVTFFQVDSRQYLSRCAPVGRHSGLMVRRKMFGRIAFEPVERFSELFNKYNEVIDLSNLYVLREDLPAAQKVIRDLGWPVLTGSASGKQANLL